MEYMTSASVEGKIKRIKIMRIMVRDYPDDSRVQQREVAQGGLEPTNVEVAPGENYVLHRLAYILHWSLSCCWRYRSYATQLTSNSAIPVSTVVRPGAEGQHGQTEYIWKEKCKVSQIFILSKERTKE